MNREFIFENGYLKDGQRRYRRRACDLCRYHHARCDGASPCSRCSRLGKAEGCVFQADSDTLPIKCCPDTNNSNTNQMTVNGVPTESVYGADGLLNGQQPINVPLSSFMSVASPTDPSFADCGLSSEAVATIGEMPRKVVSALRMHCYPIFVTLFGPSWFFGADMDARVLSLSREQLKPVEDWIYEQLATVFSPSSHEPLLSADVPCVMWRYASVFDQLHVDQSFPCPRDFLASNNAFARHFGWSLEMLRQYVRSPSFLCHVEDLFVVLDYAMKRFSTINASDADWSAPIEVHVPKVRVLLPNGDFRPAALTLRVLRSPARIPAMTSCSLLPL